MLMARIKEAMFSVFGENHKLPPINLNIKESKIRKWKRTEAVRNVTINYLKKLNHQNRKRTCRKSSELYGKTGEMPQRCRWRTLLVYVK